MDLIPSGKITGFDECYYKTNNRIEYKNNFSNSNKREIAIIIDNYDFLDIYPEKTNFVDKNKLIVSNSQFNTIDICL